ncbi:hypothetical protein A4H97_12910 [Niastella yeongjuensis]|uniref:DUF4197 domain-containing protein n=2 Tax=Niastella yeongjuensis TaxID=354355 RepID=A0A1V9EB99_9BACT|nr:hypothetical protein A4H97_12910 [Niastella yeongjuensis]
MSMKRIVLPLLLLTSVASFAQSSLLKKASSVLSKATGSTTGTGLSTDEIIAGLKDALSVGATNSATKLSAVDGFFANAAIKVLMPPEAQKVETALRAAGMGKLVDNAILSMNRAAEDASKSAAPIFVNAIKSMSISDALGILKGSDTAATGYLRGKTTAALTTAFRPIIDTALQKTSATSYWKTVFDAYNKLPLVKNKINPDLAGYVTEKSLGGMFFQVAQEEQKIRKDPAARVTDILKKVFGNSGS